MHRSSRTCMRSFARWISPRTEWARRCEFLMETGRRSTRAAQRVRAALRHAGRVDAHGVARAGAEERRALQRRDAGHRGHGRRALLLGRRAGRARWAPIWAKDVPGEPALYCGRVTDIEGRPLPGALLDVWSGDGEGNYDVQLGDPPHDARARPAAHRRRRPLLLLVDQALGVSDSRRRRRRAGCCASSDARTGDPDIST